MGAIIEVLEEIRLRLQAGIDANDIESSHNNVYVGSKSRLLKMNDMTQVGIIIPSGDGSYECMRYGQTEELNIQIGYTIPVLQDDYNTIYKYSDQSGPLRNLEQILNYVATNRATGAPDLQLNGKAHNALTHRWSMQEITESNLLFFYITITVKTGKYERGSL